MAPVWHGRCWRKYQNKVGIAHIVFYVHVALLSTLTVGNIHRDRMTVIWAMKESAILHHPQQVWVHVDYIGYRGAYARAFPDETLKDLVLDHILNRKMARAMRFDYLRIVPISRGTNSSSGGLPEKWGIAYQSSPKMVQINAQRKSFIKYADLQDIVKMLNLKSGGALQDAVNEAQSLVNEPMIPAGS
jgi:hypothetical protein